MLFECYVLSGNDQGMKNSFGLNVVEEPTLEQIQKQVGNLIEFGFEK